MILKKMMNKSINFSSKIISCVILIFLYACEHRRIGNDSFIVTTDGNDHLQSEIHYINDTIMHGLAKYYYYPKPVNVLKDEIEYVNGVKDGWQRHYREDGTLESKVNYKNGLANGMDYRYYENGIKIKSEHYWTNGKPYGIGKWYYKNGQMETFAVTDFNNKCSYIINWDSLGNKVKEDGVVFSPEFIVLYVSDSTATPIMEKLVKAEKGVAVKIAVSQPPQTKTKIRMGELNKNNMKELPIENNTAIYKTAFSEVGIHTLITIGEITDLNGKVIKKDSTSMNIMVVGN